MHPSTLLKIVKWYVPKWLKVDSEIFRAKTRVQCTRIGHLRSVEYFFTCLRSIVPCINYTLYEHLDSYVAVQRSILDTFDALSAYYDKPETIENFRSWHLDAGLKIDSVRDAGGILVGRAIKK